MTLSTGTISLYVETQSDEKQWSISFIFLFLWILIFSHPLLVNELIYRLSSSLTNLSLPVEYFSPWISSVAFHVRLTCAAWIMVSHITVRVKYSTGSTANSCRYMLSKVDFFRKSNQCIVTTLSKKISIPGKQTAVYDFESVKQISRLKCPKEKLFRNWSENDTNAV